MKKSYKTAFIILTVMTIASVCAAVYFYSSAQKLTVQLENNEKLSQSESFDSLCQSLEALAYELRGGFPADAEGCVSVCVKARYVTACAARSPLDDGVRRRLCSLMSQCGDMSLAALHGEAVNDTVSPIAAEIAAALSDSPDTAVFCERLNGILPNSAQLKEKSENEGERPLDFREISKMKPVSRAEACKTAKSIICKNAVFQTGKSALSPPAFFFYCDNAYAAISMNGGFPLTFALAREGTCSGSAASGGECGQIIEKFMKSPFWNGVVSFSGLSLSDEKLTDDKYSAVYSAKSDSARRIYFEVDRKTKKICAFDCRDYFR